MEECFLATPSVRGISSLWIRGNLGIAPITKK
jgi:hypothetical protein